jgi:hypothetical protein
VLSLESSGDFREELEGRSHMSRLNDKSICDLQNNKMDGYFVDPSYLVLVAKYY